MLAISQKLQLALLAFALLCDSIGSSHAQSAIESDSLQKIGPRLSRLSAFLDKEAKVLAVNQEASTFRAGRERVAKDKDDIAGLSDRLKQINSEISGLSADEAVKRLDTLAMPRRVQELLLLAPDGSKLPLAPHQELLRATGTGLGPRTVKPYVVGPGSAATVDYPSVANITYAWSGLGHSTLCTGTLISADAVLTAAHCFCDFVVDPNANAATQAKERNAGKCSSTTYNRGLETLKPTDTKYFRVFFQDEGPLEVKEIIIDPKYNWPKKDLAIMRLSKPIANIMPAPLNDIGPVPGGSFATVVGFGVHSALTNGKGEAAAQQIPSSAGLKLWATIKAAKCVGPLASEELLCWNYQPRIADQVLGSTCHGDLGGPLFAKFKDDWRLSGVTSGGPTSGEECPFSTRPQDQSFDVDIFKNLDWIRTTAKISRSAVAGKTAFLLNSASRAYAVPYYLFTSQPEKWVSQFFLPDNLKSVTISINTTPTFSQLVLELTPPNAIPPAAPACRNEGVDSFATCTLDKPIGGMWTISITGSRPQESQVVAAAPQ